MELKSLSLYVHVPFCARKCNYCDFYSIPLEASLADEYLDALLIEWELLKKKYSLEGIPIETLYFGGGTPSMLSLGQWKRIMEKFIRPLAFTSSYEWSIECNPDSFSGETALLWLDSGVTRLSIGVQSLIDRELAFMGRVHNAGQALDLLEHPLLLKFNSVGADLMYGIPCQTLDSLTFSLDTTLGAESIRHLSAYELTLNEHTDFGKRRSRGLLPLPSEETAAAMTETVKQKTCARGFEQYEVSNFSPPGRHCRHNEAYWRHKPYIGLGPAAHSYLPRQRFSNVGSLDDYTNRLRGRELPTGFCETLDAAALSREMVFLGLRTKQGVNETDFRAMTGMAFASTARLPAIERYVRKGLLEHSPPYWRLIGKGMLFADAVARDLF
jgi:oxygen-independent coproporphyrinogen III oxidase